MPQENTDGFYECYQWRQAGIIIQGTISAPPVVIGSTCIPPDELAVFVDVSAQKTRTGMQFIAHGFPIINFYTGNNTSI